MGNTPVRISLPVGLVQPFDNSPVVRCFGKAEYVEAMMRGEIYISTLEACRNAENRFARDEEDGKLHHVVGRIAAAKMTPDVQRVAAQMGISLPSNAERVEIGHSRAVEVIPDAHVLCCSARRSPELVRRFGRFGVRILDPFAFAEEVTRAMVGALGIDVGALQLGSVTYGPPETRDFEAPAGLVGFVKRRDLFGVEEEVRLLWHTRTARPPLPSLMVIAPSAVRYIEPMDPAPEPDAPSE